MNSVLVFDMDRQAREAKLWYGAIGAQQIAETYVVQGTSNSYVYALPRAPDTADAFMLTQAVDRTALGYRDRSFQRVDDIGSANLMRAAR
jgi:hypothetical protein